MIEQSILLHVQQSIYYTSSCGESICNLNLILYPINPCVKVTNNKRWCSKTLNYARVCRVILHNREIRKYLRRNIVELYLCFKQPIHWALNCVDGGGGRLVRCAICRAARGGRRVRGHVCHLQRAVLQCCSSEPAADMSHPATSTAALLTVRLRL